MVGNFQKLTRAIEKDTEKASLRKQIKRESQSIKNALTNRREYTLRDTKGRTFRISPSNKNSE
jgi:cell division protein ZapA (FtsZ GTPase activity inhibitor)